MPTVTQKATASVYVNGDTSTTRAKNYSSYATFRAGTSPQLISYLYFNRPFPIGATIVSAHIEITQSQPTTGTREVNARRVNQSWKLSTINHNNRPGVTGTQTATSLGSGIRGRVWTIDTTAQMQAVSDGAPWYGLRIYTDLSSAIHFFDHGSSEFGPRLVVEYTMAPPQPSDLTPSGGRAVSLARPTLLFGYSSADASPLTSIQVQMNEGVADFTTPDHDSGEVASTLAQYLVPFDINAAEVWFWRARVKNASGVWSAWSNAAEFTRVVKPTLTITAPGDTPNDVVTDATPPFGWTFSGTQLLYRVLVSDLTTGALLWDSKTVASSDLSVTYPATAPLLQSGGSYRVTVQATDDVGRVASPGDPVYVSASRDFTFVLSTVAVPTTGLTASVTPGDPRVALSWSRTEAPDAWLISRDGVAVARVDGPDLLISGTTYGWTDLGVATGDHEWSVASVANDETEDDAPTVAGSVTVHGVWLMTLDDEHAVNMAGAEGRAARPSVAAQEVSEVHLPLGATNPVLITQAVFGRRGDDGGNLVLAERGSSTLASKTAAWDAIVDRERYPRGTPMMLTWSDTPMRVFIFNPVRDAESEFTDSIPVGFEFCELR